MTNYYTTPTTKLVKVPHYPCHLIGESDCTERKTRDNCNVCDGTGTVTLVNDPYIPQNHKRKPLRLAKKLPEIEEIDY